MHSMIVISLIPRPLPTQEGPGDEARYNVVIYYKTSMGIYLTELLAININIYHIRFLCEDVILEALRSHPLHGQLDNDRLVLTEVLFCSNIFSKPKVGNFNNIVCINPSVRMCASNAMWIFCQWYECMHDLN